MTPEQQEALAIAHTLVDHGVPVFIAEPELDDEGEWVADGGHSGTGYWLPEGWQKTKANKAVVKRWKPGQALCAVMGVVVDLVDVDPRHGGEDSHEEMSELGLTPLVYGRATTPSEGVHEFIHTMGVRSRDSLFPGIDIKAGDGDGVGRGFAFIAPTVKLSKGGMLGTYKWEGPPDLESLELMGLDPGARALSEAVIERHLPGHVDPYDGPDYDELEPWLRELSDADFKATLELWRGRLALAAEWDDVERDDKDRGWEALAYQFAWVLATRLAHPAYALDQEHEALQLYLDIMPDVILSDPKCRGKLDTGRFEAAEATEPFNPPWYTPFPAGIDDGDSGVSARVKPVHSFSSVADSYHWLIAQLGREGTPLAGMFARTGEIVYTPRVGELGYVEPEHTDDDDGPAQIRRVGAGNIAAAVDTGYNVLKVNQSGPVRALFNRPAAERVVDTSLDELKGLRRVKGVTHTPITRKDGTIFASPGYDEATHLLYLPSSRLIIPEVGEDVEGARALLDELLEGFPWVSEHDHANYLAGLLTPLLRNMLEPPYKLLAIGAPQPGSGKSLLAQVMRIVHGGVFRSEFPENKAELRKQITSILDSTSAPVVQWDNVSGVLKSPVLDSLLTSAIWSDRVLGVSVDVLTPNDRLWVITGNNLRIGGDLARRTLWITIDAEMEHPETRTDFVHTDLADWVAKNRGKILWALLTLINGWVAAGRPVDKLKTTDSFSRWVQVTGGIVKHGGWAGVVGHQDSMRQKESDEEYEWGLFLGALHEHFGDDKWTAKQVLHMVTFEELDAELVPDQVLEKLKYSPAGASKSLGRWLLNRRNRWVGGFTVHQWETKTGSKWSIEGR